MCSHVLCFMKVELDGNLWLNQLTEVLRTWHV